RLDAAAPHAGVAFHKNGERLGASGKSGGETVYRLGAVSGDRDVDAIRQGAEAIKLGWADDVVGQKDLSDARIGHGFGFAQLLDGDAKGSKLDRPLGE